MKFNFLEELKNTYRIWRYWRSSILIYDPSKININLSVEKPSEVFLIFNERIQQCANQDWRDIPLSTIENLEFFVASWRDVHAKD